MAYKLAGYKFKSKGAFLQFITGEMDDLAEVLDRAEHIGDFLASLTDSDLETNWNVTGTATAQMPLTLTDVRDIQDSFLNVNKYYRNASPSSGTDHQTRVKTFARPKINKGRGRRLDD